MMLLLERKKVFLLLVCFALAAALFAQDAPKDGELFPQTGHGSLDGSWWNRPSVNFAEWSPGGGRIATAGSGVVKIWDAASGKELLSLTGHSDTVLSVMFTSNGRRVISGSSDGTVRLWDISGRGAEILRFLNFADGAWICHTPDGYYAASPGADDHLNIRLNGQLHSMEEYRSTYNRPDIVAERLKE
jgi:WD40 repeat protein